MYRPKHFEERDTGVLHSLIRSHPLGAWVTTVDGMLEVNHIPFLLDEARGEHGTLIGHVARANPVWRTFSSTIESVVIFQGPQAYITPSWYASKREHGKAVPTWNYAVVHAHGTPRPIEDKAWLLAHVTALSNFHESARSERWSVSDAPADYIETLLKAIVGIEIPIATIAGKWKASQNRSLADKLGTLAGLRERGDETALAMAALVDRHVNQPAPDRNS
jgi:transcriptional regulator